MERIRTDTLTGKIVLKKYRIRKLLNIKSFIKTFICTDIFSKNEESQYFIKLVSSKISKNYIYNK